VSSTRGAGYSEFAADFARIWACRSRDRSVSIRSSKHIFVSAFNLASSAMQLTRSSRLFPNLIPGLDNATHLEPVQWDSKKLAHAIRSHWEIENRMHWCLDVSFNEDASRIRTDHAPENMNIVKKIAMNLLRLNPLKRSLPKKRLKACLNNQYLTEVLGIST
jgi:hypothetical protein